MTWGEWCDSSYNTIGAYATVYDITIPTGGRDDKYIFNKEFEYVLAHNVIIANYPYIASV